MTRKKTKPVCVTIPVSTWELVRKLAKERDEPIHVLVPAMLETAHRRMTRGRKQKGSEAK